MKKSFLSPMANRMALISFHVTLSQTLVDASPQTWDNAMHCMECQFSSQICQ